MAANCNDSLTTFNKQAVWDEQCVPALRRLVSLCSIYDIPLFVTACIRNDRSGSVYMNDVVSPDIKGIVLREDHIPKHLAVMRGYDVHLPDQPMTCTCPISSAACRRWRTWTRYSSTDQ